MPVIEIEKLKFRRGSWPFAPQGVMTTDNDDFDVHFLYHLDKAVEVLRRLFKVTY